MNSYHSPPRINAKVVIPQPCRSGGGSVYAPIVCDTRFWGGCSRAKGVYMRANCVITASTQHTQHHGKQYLTTFTLAGKTCIRSLIYIHTKHTTRGVCERVFPKVFEQALLMYLLCTLHCVHVQPITRTHTHGRGPPVP